MDYSLIIRLKEADNILQAEGYQEDSSVRKHLSSVINELILLNGRIPSHNEMENRLEELVKNTRLDTKENDYKNGFRMGFSYVENYFFGIK